MIALSALLLAGISPVSAAPPAAEPVASLLTASLVSGSGSTVGPDGALYVTEGAAGRISRVDPQTGAIATFASGLPVWGNTIFMAVAGPLPHLPEGGMVVAFGPNSLIATDVASGAGLLVDVEFGRGRTVFAHSQGVHSSGVEGSPADPDTGALVEVNGDGSFTVIMGGLDRPTSLEFIGHTAYVVTVTGEIWKIDGVSGPPYGGSR